MNRRIAAVTAALLGTAVLVASCGSSNNGTTPSSNGSSVAVSSPAAAGGGSSAAPATSGAPASFGTITVLAASSLKRSFDALATQFQQAHPGMTVKVSYDGSSTLATQITGGAPADVFASADQKNMTTVTAAGLAAGTPTLFASNTLQIAVAPGNPKKITSLADLAKSGVVTVLCAPAVPCGSAAHSALDAAKVTVKPASEEQNVTAVLTKVESGDADAGLVYVTDVSSAGGKVLGVNFREASKAVNHYPIVALKAAPNAAGAKAFVDLVLGPDGQKTLAGFGFAKP
ncbi:MAG: molybdate ABC transporter substrate-binding protein [Actinomycetota bacterium]|nr:molybdate ABC transporter substrate-binding protein [Actinomycetota bacterium]